MHEHSVRLPRESIGPTARGKVPGPAGEETMLHTRLFTRILPCTNVCERPFTNDTALVALRETYIISMRIAVKVHQQGFWMSR